MSTKSLKTLVTISLLLLTVTVFSIFGSILIVNQRDKQTKSVSALGTESASQTSQPASETKILTAEIVAQHNLKTDCWMIISGNVYNLTSFLATHPGGFDSMIPFCGKDGTLAFETKDKSPASKHSQTALNMLPQYLIGKLGENIPSPTAEKQNVVSLVTPTTSQVNKPITVNAANTGVGTTLTTAEVANHNTPADCWIIISNNVYGVSSYLTAHPAGAGAITPYCGLDATSAFSTKGGKGSNHSSNAYSLLANYLIGSLGTTTTIASLPSTVTTSPTNNIGNTGTSNSGILPSSVSSKYPGATISKQEIEDDGRQELKIIYNGSCIKIKLNSSGSITKEEGC